MSNKDKKTEPTSRAVAEKRIRAIDKRIAAIKAERAALKAERTELNRQKHFLAGYLRGWL